MIFDTGHRSRAFRRSNDKTKQEGPRLLAANVGMGLSIGRSVDRGRGALYGCALMNKSDDDGEGGKSMLAVVFRFQVFRLMFLVGFPRYSTTGQPPLQSCSVKSDPELQRGSKQILRAHD